MVRGKKAVCLIAAVVGCLQIMGCLRDSEEHVMQRGQDSVSFELKSGPLKIDFKVLEKMKVAIQSFLDGPDFPAQFLEVREAMRVELKSSAIWIHEGQAGIGVWRLENRDGRLVAVRYPPPRRGAMVMYLATLEPDNSGWKVVTFEQEREMGPA